MKIFLSYGHDSNAPLIEKIRDYLSKDAEGNLKHEVWIDTSEIKAGMNWREKIVKGLLESDIVLAGLSEHSTKEPGVCRDEISISIGVKGGNIRTILLEPSNKVAPPAMISHIQWLDMSDWKEHKKEGFESGYFQDKFRQIAEMIETPENERFNGEITEEEFDIAYNSLKEYKHPDIFVYVRKRSPFSLRNIFGDRRLRNIKNKIFAYQKEYTSNMKILKI